MQNEQQFNEWLEEQLIEDIPYWCQQFTMASKGKIEAILEIAQLYKEQQFSQEAQEWLEMGVKLNSVEAMYRLGNFYFETIEGQEGERKAFQLYERAAYLGHPDAMNNLADMYLNGEGTEVDEACAFEWFEQAAKQHVVEAQFTLGIMCEQGLGTAVNEQRAMAYYEASAVGGYEEAQYRMGMIYFLGELGQVQNIERAISWFSKAAQQFHVDALFNLGYISELEEGMEQRAIQYYKQASMLGDFQATKKLASYYEAINSKQAIKWQERMEYLTNN